MSSFLGAKAYYSLSGLNRTPKGQRTKNKSAIIIMYDNLFGLSKLIILKYQNKSYKVTDTLTTNLNKYNRYPSLTTTAAPRNTVFIVV